ncbi:hypothetical protein J6590_063715 [Homalodisca vitripennis]|nr:hypothetical protein J6590_063715 [Homalodisca vitripennis]
MIRIMWLWPSRRLEEARRQAQVEVQVGSVYLLNYVWREIRVSAEPSQCSSHDIRGHLRTSPLDR